jgi:uncharacterized protein
MKRRNLPFFCKGIDIFLIAVYLTAYGVIITAMTQPLLAQLFGSKLRSRLIGWMMTHVDERFFVRQLTAILGEDSTNVSRELARLSRMGILTSQKEGKQKYYQVNRECPIFPELRGLAVKTMGLTDVLRQCLSEISHQIKTAFIYGSFARSDEGKTSDVDVMVIGDATFAEVVAALGSAQQDLGREINPTVYPAGEFRKKLLSGNHFLTSLMNEPMIFVIGDRYELEGLAR